MVFFETLNDFKFENVLFPNIAGGKECHASIITIEVAVFHIWGGKSTLLGCLRASQFSLFPGVQDHLLFFFASCKIIFLALSAFKM